MAMCVYVEGRDAVYGVHCHKANTTKQTYLSQTILHLSLTFALSTSPLLPFRPTSSMAIPTPSFDGIGIANLPNQVCENSRRAALHADASNYDRGIRLSQSVVGTSPLWLLVCYSFVYRDACLVELVLQANLDWAKPRSSTPCSRLSCHLRKITASVISSSWTSSQRWKLLRLSSKNVNSRSSSPSSTPLASETTSTTATRGFRLSSSLTTNTKHTCVRSNSPRGTKRRTCVSMLAFTSYAPQVTRVYFFRFPIFCLLNPRHRLKPLDIEIMKRLGTRVNLIPVVAKADTLTQNDLYTFKQRVCAPYRS